MLRAVAVGTVRAEDGGFVEGATVRSHALFSSCSDPLPTPDPDSLVTTTGSDGAFAHEVRAPSLPGPACVRIEVQPPSASDLGSAADTASVDFHLLEEPPDTVEFEIVLVSS